jgi:hypothetical protein
MRTSLAPLLLLLLAPLALAAPYTPCHAPYGTLAAAAFETPCFSTLATLGAGVQVRSYPHARTAQLVHVNLTGRIANFSEAVSNGAEFLFCYFFGACSAAHENLYSSRTVPLLVRPPQRGAKGDPAWAIDMALAPSLWPGPAPAGENGITILPLASALVAARHCAAPAQPTEGDFLACLALLHGEAGALRGAGFAIDAAGPWTPTYAFFTLQNQTAPPFDLEVWASVKRV